MQKQDRIKSLREEHIKDYDWRELELFRRQVEKHLPKQEDKIIELIEIKISDGEQCLKNTQYLKKFVMR